LFEREKFLENSLRESSETKLKMIDACREDIFKASDAIKTSFTAEVSVMHMETEAAPRTVSILPPSLL
jgi:uncharacterized protein